MLQATDRATAAARREVTLSRGRHGMVSVAGGKLTTYRVIARAVLEMLRADLGLHRLDTRARPLPGATDPAAEASALRRGYANAEPELLEHLARTYGTLAHEVLAYRSSRADALEPLVDGAPDVVAQALYARDREWAVDPEDVSRRRTTLAMRGLDSPALRQRLLGLLERSAAPDGPACPIASSAGDVRAR